MADRSPKRRRSWSRERGNFAKKARSDATKRVFVSNLPFGFKWPELKDMFRNQVGEVAFVDIFTDEHDKSLGLAVVEFRDSIIADLAAEKMNKHDVNGRRISVIKDFEDDRDYIRAKRIQKKKELMGMGLQGGIPGKNFGPAQQRPQMQQFANTYGLSPAFLDSLGIAPPLLPRIFVGHLANCVTRRKLKEIFRFAGRVVHIDLFEDDEGKCKGHALIEFEHPIESVQAISMFNGQTLFDRKMTIKMDKITDRNEKFPFRLPVGLKGMGMGLGPGGTPLRDVVRTLQSGPNPEVGPNPMNANKQLPPQQGMPQSSGPIGEFDGFGMPGRQDNMNFGGMDFGMGDGPGFSGPVMGTNNGFPSPMTSNSGPSQTNLAALQAEAEAANARLAAAMGMANMGRGDSVPSFGKSTNIGSFGNQMGSAAVAKQMKDEFFSGMDAQSSKSASSGRKSNTVLISNLPQGATRQMLRNKFQDVGEVKFTEMKQKGIGIVEFASARDADRAVSLLDRSLVDGRPIGVQLY